MRRLHQPPRTLNILNKIVVHPPETEKVKSKMTSVESIGSCSLDVDATASEASEDGRTSSVSQRTLHSTSIELGSGSSGVQGQVVDTTRSPTKSSKSMASTTIAESSKGVASSSSEKRFVSELYIPSGRIHGGHERIDDSDLQRKPSYINLSCSVSGYTSYSCYNSKVREELRSRDSSPARFGLYSTNEAATGDLPTMNLEVTEEGELKKLMGSTPTTLHTSSVTLSVNSNGTDVVDHVSRFSQYQEKSSTVWRTSSEDGILSRYQNHTIVSETKAFQKHTKDSTPNETVLQRTLNVSSEVYDDNNNSNHNGEVAEMAHHEHQDDHGSKFESKSLIEQRIERLFGPGALAPGFRIHRERKQNAKTSLETVSTTAPSELFVIKSKSHVSRYSSSIVSEKINNLKIASDGALKFQKSPKETSSNGNNWEADRFQEMDPRKKNIKATVSFNGTNGEQLHDKRLPVDRSMNSHGPDLSCIQHTEGTKCGQSFIDVMNKEREKIKSLIREAESLLITEELSEDAAGRIRAAIGKANLLLTQKLVQFQGLCEKNLNQHGDEPFPTTAEDLEGFWDMVLIQVNEIYRMFEAIEKAQKQGWISDEKGLLATDGESRELFDGDKNGSVLPLKDTHVKKPILRKPKTIQPPLSSKSEASKAREEARRRLLEAKRKGRQQAATNMDELGIEIYVPEERE